jgi:hypothetical protein
VSAPDYRQFVDPTRVPRISKLQARMSFDHYPPFLERLIGVWKELQGKPFVGITSDGSVTPDLYEVAGNGAPIAAVVKAARKWLDSLPPEQIGFAKLPLDAHERRHWHNTPLVLRDGQFEFDSLTVSQREWAMEIVRQSLSPEGYARVLNVIENNELIGRLAEVEGLMNRRAFSLTIFGEPSEVEPWGWQLFGHHLALNAFFLGEQMVMSPVFLGLEPDVPDEKTGRRMFEDHEEQALAFMRSLTEDQKAAAVLYDTMMTAEQPEGRYHPDDGRHVGGAFQDNRVVPYEGLKSSDLNADQRAALMKLAGLFIGNLQAGPKQQTLDQIEAHLDETWFAWIGKVDDVNPFYFRIHSPVTLIEFDHHSGIFLTNPEPERLHVHTIVRTPNGGDYGMAVLQQHKG